MKRLVLTVAMVAALAACSRGASSPAGVAEEFMRKLSNGDCTGLGDYLAASSKSVAPKLEQACQMQAAEKKNDPKAKALSSVNVLETTENGDRATVRLEGVFSDGTKEGGDAITLVREDGRWKIDLLAAKGAQGGSGSMGPMGPTPTPPMPAPAPMPAPMGNGMTAPMGNGMAPAPMGNGMSSAPAGNGMQEPPEGE